MASRSNTIAVVGASCSVFGVAGWIFYVIAFRGLHGEDWMVYYTAARMAIEGKSALLYDGDRLTAELNVHFAPWLAHNLLLHPFLYPPHFLLLLVPFGILPPAVAGTGFLMGSFAALVTALSLYANRTDERWFVAASALLCPAAAIVVCLGQNSFLTCALLVAGFGLSRDRPILGGLLLGALSYKPQLALMVPVALLASRQWKTIAAAAASAACLVLASIAAFGLTPWHDWIQLMIAPSALFEHWNVIARLNGQSIYAYAVFLGAPAAVATTMQIVSAIGAAASVYWVYRRNAPAELGLAVILTATMLSAPHLLDYDALLVEIAASLFFLHLLRAGPTIVETTAAVLIWLSPLFNPPTVFAIGAITPFLTLIFLALIIRRIRPTFDASKREGCGAGSPVYASPRDI